MSNHLIEIAREFRRKGKTYSEIRKLLKKDLPKSTIATWCKGVKLPVGYSDMIAEVNKLNLEEARRLAWKANKTKREALIRLIDAEHLELPELLEDKKIGKIALALLYLAEGSKSADRSSLMFGNSDPNVISLFMKLLRSSYDIDESKFRCTVQGRADQNFRQLQKFWSKITGLSVKQFYGSQIDPRTVGKPSKKPDYKGVCRIDYFSALLDLELKRIVQLINKNYLGPIV